ncbi:MAG: hypothetical protein IPK26_19330 [Planctomycetes bacterium]|nr:hypothetical protein [Planctomycetota bacterium]
MATAEHLGPALSSVRLADADAVQALLQEQRARLQVVRDHRIWHWFGGVPSGFGSPGAPLQALYARFAGFALIALALIVAGFTRGPVLWVIAALAGAAFLRAWLVIGPPSRRTLQLFERAVLVPGIVIAYEPEATEPDNELLRGVWALVAFDVKSVDGLQRLDAAATRLRTMLAGTGGPEAFLQSVRGAIAAKKADGSRIQVPAELGQNLELARLRVSPNLLPGGVLSSRLLFVFADPQERQAGHSRVLQSSLWGSGVDDLCEDFPLAPSA